VSEEKVEKEEKKEDEPDNVERTVALDSGVVAVFDGRVEEGAVENDPGGEELDAIEVTQPRELDVTLVLAAVGDVGAAEEAVNGLETGGFRTPTEGRRVVGGAARSRSDVLSQLVPSSQPHLLVLNLVPVRAHDLGASQRRAALHVHGVGEGVSALTGGTAAADSLVTVVGEASIGRVGRVTVGRVAVGGRVERGGVGEVGGRTGSGGRVTREGRSGTIGGVRLTAVLLIDRVGGRVGGPTTLPEGPRSGHSSVVVLRVRGSDGRRVGSHHRTRSRRRGGGERRRLG
jgi:hypothetical protein